MIRFGSAATVLAASFVILAACSNNDDDEEPDLTEPAAVEPAAVEPAAVEPIEVEPAVVEPAAQAAPIEPAPAPDEPAIVVDSPAPAIVVQEDGKIVGEASAIESATIQIGDTRIMLYGLESVYPPQTCSIDGQMWECWAAAFRQLQTYLGEGPVSCTPIGVPDILGRVLALCEVAGESLNERYVRSGFALAIEDEMPEYATAEAAAREEGIGLWQGAFMEPGDFRLSRGIFMRRP